MRKLFLLKTMLLLCALIVGSSSAWADDTESVTFSDEYEDKEKPTSYTGTDFSIAFSKGDGSNDPQYYASGTGVRLYIKNTMTISSSTKKIKSIALTYKMNGSSSTYPTGVSASTGTANISTTSSSTSGSWTAADETTASVTFTVNGSKGNIQVQTITVTFVEADPDAPSATLNTTSLAFGDIEIGTTKGLTFTVTPANLTGDLTIASNNSKYTVTPTSIAQTTTTATTITVTAAPTALNDNMAGTITISGGGLTSNKTVTLTASPYQVANVTLTGEYGTFKVGDETVTSLTSRVGSTATIKAVPARGYSFTSWAAVGATPATSSNAETEFTFTAAEVTLTATFTVIPKYTVTLGDDNSTLTEEYGGEGVELPSRNTVADYTFAGWSTTNIETETTTAPNGIISAGNYKPAANIILYPVYTRSEVTSFESSVSANISEQGWTNGTKYTSLVLNGDITASVDGGSNSGKYYSTGTSWRIYSSEDGTLTITANSGCSLESVTLTFTGESTTKPATVEYNGTTITSGTAVDVTGTSAEFAVTGGQARITNISVTYLSENSIVYYISAPVTTSPVTITAAKYATYCGARALNFSGTGITAYTATEGETSVKLNEITSGKVPARTPVVLYKEGADGTAINVPVIASADAIEGTNDLNVVGAGGLTGVDNIYVLAKNPTIGFYLWDKTQTLNEGKVYLQAASSSRSFLGFEEGNTTGVADINRETITNNGSFFDLQGRKVANPTKGLYIVNGKKVVK